MNLEKLDFVLPGVWWRLPMNDGDGATDIAIRRILDTSVGRRDQDAQVRAEARRYMRELVAAGREVGAEQIHFAKTLVGALPFPATLMVSWPDFPVTPRGTPAERANVVAAAVPHDLCAETIVMPQLCAVRTISVRPAQKAEDGALTRIAHLEVAYYLAVDGIEKTLIFSFTTALIALREEIIGLFDAIVSTVSVRKGAVVAGATDVDSAGPSSFVTGQRNSKSRSARRVKATES